MGVVVEELLAQARLSLGCLGYHQQSAGVLVYAVHQSYLRVVGIVCGQMAQVPCDGMYQRTVEIAAARMYHHACGFVDDHQVVVFVAYVEWNILRHDGRIVVRAVEHQCHHIAGTHLIVALHRTLVDMNKTCVGRLLYAVAGLMGHVLRQIFVYA